MESKIKNNPAVMAKCSGCGYADMCISQATNDKGNLTYSYALQTTERIGCCSSYRDCSNAKRCVSTVACVAENCAYNDNLKQNKVFYGKNALGFDADAYANVVNLYNSLSDNAKQILNSWIVGKLMPQIYTFVIERKDEAPELFESGLLINERNPQNASLILNFKVKVLDSAGNPELTENGAPKETFLIKASDFDKLYPTRIATLKEEFRTRNLELPARQKLQLRDIIEEHLRNDGDFALAEPLYNLYTVVSFAEQHRKYIREIFYDYITSTL